MTNELLGMHAAGTNISEHGSDVLPVKTDAERTQELLAKAETVIAELIKVKKENQTKPEIHPLIDTAVQRCTELLKKPSSLSTPTKETAIDALNAVYKLHEWNETEPIIDTQALRHVREMFVLCLARDQPDGIETMTRTDFRNYMRSQGYHDVLPNKIFSQISNTRYQMYGRIGGPKGNDSASSSAVAL